MGEQMSGVNLQRHIAEQLELLQVTGATYDAGNVVTYKQLAVIVRVLVHDTPKSNSLLGQLGTKESLDWLSAGGVNPKNLVSTNALTWMRVNVGEGSATMSYEPYDEQRCLELGRRVTFDEWWNGPVIKDAQGNEFTRREITLAVANKDGGAHVDTLPERVRALAEDGTLGWSFGTDDEREAITLSPIPATMRAIATELHLALHNQRVKLGMESV